ncbi:MAG: hypothetical protein QE278_05535 [Limnobacter sp.]|nr:hypothetical protein [Limnobacter sp.]
MVDQPKVVACMPIFDHGDTEERPSPTPKISRIKDNDAAAAPPAAMAPQATALIGKLGNVGPAGTGKDGSMVLWTGMVVEFMV